MDELCESLECLCNSPQRLRILGVLEGEQMDVRDLMSVLNSPRSTVQRNLSVLEDQGWVETTGSRYTTTTVGELLHEKFVKINEITATIKRLAPFFAAVDMPPEIEIGQLTDAVVATPEPAHPNAPTKRLFETFASAERIRGFVPVVSCFVVELFHKTNEREATDYEYVLTQKAFDSLRAQYDDSADVSERTSLASTEVFVHEDDIPYGLFISDKQLALTAYDEIGRMLVVIESTNETVLDTGARIYEGYRRQSTQREVDTRSMARDVRLVESS